MYENGKKTSLYSSSVFCHSSCILVIVYLCLTQIQHCLSSTSSALGVLAQYNLKNKKKVKYKQNESKKSNHMSTFFFPFVS